MLIEPTCIQVPDGLRPVRIAALRRSPRPQLVRIWAKETLSKTSSIWWMKSLQLHPDWGHEAVGIVDGLGIARYWLAIQVFSRAGADWSRSPMRAVGRLQVPAAGIPFEDQRSALSHNEGSGGTLVSVTYAGADRSRILD